MYYIEIEKSREIIANANKIALIPHFGPDGDAMGACLALNNLFEKIGKQSVVVTPNDYPDNLKWLPGNGRVVISTDDKQKAADVINTCDLVFILDHNALRRSGDLEDVLQELDAKFILIDHHLNPELDADVTISRPFKSSTCEMVYDFINDIGYGDKIDKDIATCIYSGIVTDTGNLCHNSSNAATYHIIAELMDRGMDKELVHEELYNNFNLSRIELMGYIFNNKMELIEDGKVAIISLTNEEKKKYNYNDGDIEGFANIPLSISTVKICVLFTEKDNLVKMSFRSKKGYPVNFLAAEHFNGGGHENASGGRTYKKLSGAIKHLKDKITNYI